MITRRTALKAAGTALAGSGIALPELLQAAAAGVPLSAGLPEGVGSVATLDALPGKKPLIKLSYRPPNYETPMEYFRTAITPNDAFFVRYHLSDIPEVDAKTWKLNIGGDGANSTAELSQIRATSRLASPINLPERYSAGETFDRSKNPRELKNLSSDPSRAPIVQRMKELLQQLPAK